MIVFLLTFIPNPRMNKRIELAKKLDDVRVICVRRKDENLWEPKHKDISYDIYEMDMPP